MSDIKMFVSEQLINHGIGIRTSYNNDVINIDVCPYCNNGKSKKRRASILVDNNKAIFYCHNCVGDGNGPYSFYKFLIDRNDSVNAFKYIKLVNGNDIEELDTELKNNKFIKANTSIDYITKDDIKINNKVVNLSPLNEEHKQYLLSRKINISKFKAYSCTDRYIGIPYYDNNGIYNFQFKDLETGKYVFIPNENISFELANVYNFFNINTNKPIVVTEGVFDTLFIDNAISIGGIGKYKTLYKIIGTTECKTLYVLQDNDKAGFTGALNILEEFSGDVFVFEWYTFLKDNNMLNKKIKDINDYILNSNKNFITFLQIKKYFTNNKFKKDLFKNY